MRFTVVLHHTIYPRNIGMCARAMANMGLERLVLIGPQCELTEEAKQGAAHAQAILRNAKIYPTYADFLATEGEGFRIAMSGREGRLMRPESLDETMAKVARDPEHPAHDPSLPVYLHFGPENDGLSNEEMELCHHVCYLPTYGEITSLNVSHAVLLAVYIVRTALKESPAEPVYAPAYYPTKSIKSWLEALGFDLSARRVNIEKTLNRIFLSRCPTPDELRLFDTVLQQTVRKLRTREVETARD